MKKFILIPFLLFCAWSFAQTNNEANLTFENIPIDGPRSSFIKKLLHSGKYEYKFTNASEGSVLTDTAFSYVVCLKSSKNSDNMYQVLVEFISSPMYDEWRDLENFYQEQKALLIQQYGEPSICSEKFFTDSVPDSDYAKMRGAIYKTIFEKADGSIILLMEDGDITITYENRVNASISYYETAMKNIQKEPSKIYQLFPTQNKWNFIKLERAMVRCGKYNIV